MCLHFDFSKRLKSLQQHRLSLLSDKMDDERMEMKERLEETESRAVERENNLKHQVRKCSWLVSYFATYYKIREIE